MQVLGWARRPNPLLFMVVALLAAAVLVVFLQDQALRTLRQQRGMVLQNMAERHAASAAEAIQRTLEAPVFATLSAVNHPLLRDGRLDLVAAHYATGLERFPQVDRFFLWTDQTNTDLPGEVLFFARAQAASHDAGQVTRSTLPVRLSAPGRLAIAGFSRDRRLGLAVYQLAERYARSQRIYAAIEDTIDGRAYHVLLRLFWVDARRDRYFAVLGYLIDLASVRSTLFADLYHRELAALMAGADGSPAFSLQIRDERDRLVFGQPDLTASLTGRAAFPFRFYPGDDIDGRLASATPHRLWHVQVAPASEAAMPLGALAGGYWLSGVPVLLIIIALGFMAQSRRRASELSRMQATFISHVSHQLKTPLALLSAACESLSFERVRTPAKHAQYLAIMRSETARLSTLVERVLEFSKIEQGQRVYDLETVDLAVLVRETADAFSQTLTQDGFAFTVDAPSAPLCVRGDPVALEQVLVNLLDNAAKYSADRRAISVTAAAVGSDAVFQVTDCGVGIDPSDLSRVFERFYRGSNAPADRRGFGLGLAIAREIVRAHRGRIDVDSRPGHGTTFRVSVPLLREGREQSRASLTAPVGPGRSATRQPGTAWRFAVRAGAAVRRRFTRRRPGDPRAPLGRSPRSASGETP